ncbi:MAG: hypothetical protein JWQ66_2130 [Mucilaginibacter sp.]|nr:hypothetical protein [Mucilaginibacter sp.]
MSRQTLVNFQNFILATRDSGYKSTSSALAELVDNSIEAGANRVDINIKKLEDGTQEQYELSVIDNGSGMNAKELNVALQFGGSSRFNSRSQYGRYGMGLPNSSLSQCRRVEVITWCNPDACYYNYLDIDEIVQKKLTNLHNPKKMPHADGLLQNRTGTVVHWKKCDRFSFKYLKSLQKHILSELGRIFRYPLWRGVEIFVCGEKVVPFDPLFIGSGLNLRGGEAFGEELIYQVKIPGEDNKISEIKIRFIELPVNQWAKLSNDDKKRNQIIKRAGVTVIRNEREIDYGWFFMGDKRKENYDDWWRCEISFQPELDELFGVTHTKQEIKQSEILNQILCPDLEQTAKTLNARVRQKFIDLKKNEPIVHSKQSLERTDVYLPGLRSDSDQGYFNELAEKFKGFNYTIKVEKRTGYPFFEVQTKENRLELNINEEHPFYLQLFRPLSQRRINNPADFMKLLEMLIFAAARSEASFKGTQEESVILKFKTEWGANIKTFMS